MSKIYKVNSDCKIKKINDSKALVQVEGTIKTLECDYSILTDVLDIIANYENAEEVYKKYSEMFGEDVVNRFISTLCEEKVITVNNNDSTAESVRVLIVGEGLLSDYISSRMDEKLRIVNQLSAEEFISKNGDVGLEFDTVVFAPGYATYKEFKDFNRIMVRLEIPFIPIYCTGESYICGSYVFPWKTPCLECNFTHHIKALERSTNGIADDLKYDDMPLSVAPSVSDLPEQAKYLVALLIRDVSHVINAESNFIFYKKEICFKGKIEEGYYEKKYQPITDCKCCHGLNKLFSVYNGTIDVPNIPSPYTEDAIRYNVGGLRSKGESETRDLISKAINDIGLNIEIKLVENNIFHEVLPVYDSSLKTTQKNKTPYFLDGGKSHGKGLNTTQAYFSAAFELFERLSSRYYGTETIIRATPKQVEDFRIDVRSITKQVPNVATVYDNFDENMEVDWVWGKSLVTGNERLIPASQVFLSGTSFKDNFVPNGSSGLSAGAVLKDAILQGLFEVIEHDAWMICQANPITLPIIDQTTLTNTSVKNTVDKIKSLGYNLIIRDYTTDLKIPVIRSWISDPKNYTKYAFNGFGCSVDAELALERSITEAVQGFLPEESIEPYEYGKIHMVDSILSRDSLFGMYYFQKKDIENNSNFISFSSIPTMKFSSVDEALKYVVNQITTVLPGSDVLFVDLTRPEFGIPVVKVLITGGIQRLSEPLVTTSDRLYDFPVKMGYRDKPFEYKDLYLGPYQH